MCFGTMGMGTFEMKSEPTKNTPYFHCHHRLHRSELAKIETVQNDIAINTIEAAAMAMYGGSNI